MSEKTGIITKEKEAELIATSAGKEITKTFISGKLSATLVIPIGIARRHGLEKPSHVVVEERDDGIMIKKIKL